MLQNEEMSIATLEHEMREYERQINDKIFEKSNSFDADKQLNAIAQKMQQVQNHLKKKYKEIFPEAANAPEEFWEAFMSL